MRQIFSIDFEEPEEIDAIRNYLKFHSKRLKVPESKVFLALAKEFAEQDKLFDYAKLKAQAEAEAKTVAPKQIGVKRKPNVNGRGPL